MSSCNYEKVYLKTTVTDRSTQFRPQTRQSLVHPAIITSCMRSNTYDGAFSVKELAGHGDLESQSEPTIIEALKPLTVVAIACGYWHSACLTDTGDVYTWGSNEFGQLGCTSINLERSRSMNDPSIPVDSGINLSALPIPVEFPDDASISAIACGSRHTACLSENNDLFSFGWNGFGQLGFEMEPQKMPGRYPHLASSDKINRISLPFALKSELSLSCGSWCTIIKEIK
nr:Regulator of chromosome condensation (RCC1) [Hymenolepis microstoma]